MCLNIPKVWNLWMKLPLRLEKAVVDKSLISGHVEKGLGMLVGKPTPFPSSSTDAVGRRGRAWNSTPKQWLSKQNPFHYNRFPFVSLQLCFYLSSFVLPCVGFLFISLILIIISRLACFLAVLILRGLNFSCSLNEYLKLWQSLDKRIL